MQTVASAPLRSLATPQGLLITSAFAYAGVFALIVAFGSPGLGIGQGFYVPIILAAAATTPAGGAVAGVGALFLYELGMHAGNRLAWSDFASTHALIRLGSYVAAGCLAGFLATCVRRMLTQALHHLDELLDLAQINVSQVIVEATAQEASPPH